MKDTLLNVLAIVLWCGAILATMLWMGGTL